MINLKLIAIAAIVVLGLGAVAFIYTKGEKAGSASVTNAVQQKTIEEIDKARKSREQTDEKVRHTPYNDLVDGL